VQQEGPTIIINIPLQMGWVLYEFSPQTRRSIYLMNDQCGSYTSSTGIEEEPFYFFFAVWQGQGKWSTPS